MGTVNDDFGRINIPDIVDRGIQSVAFYQKIKKLYTVGTVTDDFYRIGIPDISDTFLGDILGLGCMSLCK